MTARLVIHDALATDQMIVCLRLMDWLRAPVTTSRDRQDRAVFTAEVSAAELSDAAFGLMPLGGWSVR